MVLAALASLRHWSANILALPAAEGESAALALGLAFALPLAAAVSFSAFFSPFASGSASLNDAGIEVIRRVAGKIRDERAIVNVEGHTDTDQLRSSTIPRNNWELSVLRSTAVIEILKASGVDPEVLTAAGRSEYHPLDPDDKARNRRIEVVLAPNLDALFELIRSEE